MGKNIQRCCRKSSFEKGFKLRENLGTGFVKDIFHFSKIALN